MTDEVKLLGKECRFVTYVPPPEHGMPDLHVAKEIQHFSDGSKKIVLNQLMNHQRPFWVTKKGMRNHKSKKEYEKLEHLTKYMSTEADLTRSIARATGDMFRDDLRTMHGSPYVYGSDILNTALIKEQYAKKYKDIRNTPYSVAVLDTETDVLYGTGEVIMTTLTMKEVCFTAVVKKFVDGYSDVERQLESMMDEYIGDVVKERGIKAEVVFVDNAFESIKACIMKAHEIKPDFLTFWNMDFDLTKIMEACAKYGFELKDLFSDPSIPEAYRYFKYKRGPDKKVTASGKVTPIKPAQRWHTAFCPSSFYLIDSMCVFRHLRLAKQELQSYSLDFVLGHLKLKKKLKFKAADDYSGLKWHQFMQKNYPLEYIIYNRFDCIAVELADEKTKDLCSSLPMYSGYSDFQHFRSQPRRIVDDLHFQLLKKGLVMATTSKSMEEEFDKETMGLTGWIITLPAHTIADTGLRIIEEFPELATNLHQDVADLDVKGSYPFGQACMNISRETTVKEIITIEGVDEHTFRMQGIGLSGGPTNSLEYCQLMMNFPTMEDLRKRVVEKRAAAAHAG